jgi:endonuclease/exonuclease/phosphatase family metal-dependent hydrolase
VRLASYNVRSLKQDRAAVVTVLRALAADVVALQEPPKWWLGRMRLRKLAADCGLEVVVPGGLLGARASLAATARDARAVRLRLRLRGRRHWYPTLRGVALATFGTDAARDAAADDAPIVVACLHLSLDPGERAGHLRVIEREVARSAARAGGGWPDVVVAGDLNELPGGPAWLALEARGLDDTGAADGRPTFSPEHPRRRLDVVLAGRRFVGRAHRLDHELAVRASDHFPVVVDLAVAR